MSSLFSYVKLFKLIMIWFLDVRDNLAQREAVFTDDSSALIDKSLSQDLALRAFLESTKNKN